MDNVHDLVRILSPTKHTPVRVWRARPDRNVLGLYVLFFFLFAFCSTQTYSVSYTVNGFLEK